MRRIYPAFILSIILLSAAPAFAYWEWTPQTKKWINPNWAAKDTPKAQFEYAEQFRKTGKTDRAIREHNKLIKYYPKSEYAPQSCLILGQIYQEHNNSEKAFDYYQKIVDNYPQSNLIDDVLDRQYAIAEKVLKEKSNKFMTLLQTEDHKVKRMIKVIENDPYDEDAPDRYLTLADFYIKTKDYDKAVECYEKLTEEYPETKSSEQAHVLLIKTRYLSIPKVNTDIEEYDKLQDEIKDFLVEYPNGKDNKVVTDLNASLDEEKAGKLFQIASYYERARKKTAARIYYQKVVDKFPQTNHGKTAQQKLSTLH